jgi:hypothetical protein
VRIESGFEAALEIKVGARRAPNVDETLEGGGTPGESDGGIFFGAEGEDGGGGFGET